MSSYCDVAPGDPWHGPYHDTEYGFPLSTDADLFERLMLEINQAGLSWLTILKKREGFRRAYDGFDPARVARYGARQRRRLLADAGIIRNRLKVEAAIANAKAILEFRESHGGFHEWLVAHRPPDEIPVARASLARTAVRVRHVHGDDARTAVRAYWVALFKRTFRFTGGEIVGEFLMSTGWLPGAHRESCPVYRRVVKAKPMWVAGD